MMQAEYTTANGKLKVRVTAETQKELFREVSKIAEIFEAEPCGLCESENVRFRTRTAGAFEFYELHCLDCDATRQYGQLRDGAHLFPKGEWSKYEATEGHA
jgi:hypothetical protein